MEIRTSGAAREHSASNSHHGQKVTFWPLVSATFFMVSGGPYGLEDLVSSAGYGRALLVLLVTPILWSLPTALMVGELASAIPDEGGFYVWVRRAMGTFWGFQESWLSLVASVFDMAIYPTLFLAYLVRLVPWFAVGHRGLAVQLGLIGVCVVWNLAGAEAVGSGSELMLLVLLGPFALLTTWAVFHPPTSIAAPPLPPGGSLLAGILICMWNFMGWDNASTVAAEVDRPQRTYPLAMLTAVALVTAVYMVPIAAMMRTHIAPAEWTTGSWADLAARVAGPWLRVLIVCGGMVSTLGTFNSLVMSYSRLPLAMAEDSLLPRVFTRLNRKDVPWFSVLVCSAGWAAALGIGFAMAIPPMALIVVSVFQSETEHIAGMNALTFGALLIAAGAVIYPLTLLSKRRRASVR